MAKKKLSADSLSQCLRIKAYLIEHGSATVGDMYSKLDIMHPPARIFDLRHKFGLNIQTVWEKVDTGLGVHRVGRYILKAGKYQG